MAIGQSCAALSANPYSCRCSSASITSRAIATTGRSSLGPQLIRLRPAPHGRTRIAELFAKVTPAQHFVNWQQDPHGNWVARFIFPEKTREFSIDGRSHRRTGGRSIRSTSSSSPMPRPFPSPIRPSSRTSSRPISMLEPPGPRLRRLPRRAAARADRHRALSRRSQQPRAARRPLRRAHGARRADAGGDADAGAGSCRDSAWLLVQVLRHLGLAGALRLRLPDPAASPTSTPLDGPAGTEQRLHRPARLGGGLSSRAPAGSGSIRPRACSAGEGTSRSPRRRITAPPRRSPARSSRPRSTFSLRDERRAHRRDAARHAPFSDEAWARARCARRDRSMPISRRRTCA